VCGVREAARAAAIWMILSVVVAGTTALMTVPRKLPETPPSDDLRYAEEVAAALRSLRAEARAAALPAGPDTPAADAGWWAGRWAAAEPARAAAV